MTNREITKTLQRLNGIWGGLDRKQNRDRYREYGEFLQSYKCDYMDRAIETLRGASMFLPKLVELDDIYKIEVLKDEEQQKIKEENARRERNEADEYRINCMVCLDHGVIWRDEIRKIGGSEYVYQISYYCDQCEKGHSMIANEIRHDERGHKISVECIDTPISKVMDPDIIAERNGMKYENVKLTDRPAGVYMRMSEPVISAEALEKAEKLLKDLGVEAE